MAWHLTTDQEYEVFNRNPLVSVSFEIRYHPILSIISDSSVSDFQAVVREYLPEYARQQGKQFEIKPAGFEIVDTIAHRFFDNKTQSTLVLSKDSLNLSLKSHVSKKKTLEIFLNCIDALVSVTGGVTLNRFGVRYVNIIDREEIAHELDESADWPELVQSSFLTMPCGLADLDGTLYTNEINSPMERGRLIMRYGMLPKPQHSLKGTEENNVNGDVAFRYDIDRVIEGEIDIKEIESFSDSFVTDIYNIFLSMRGEKLTKWMKLEDADE